jgi:hypothetical protein
MFGLKVATFAFANSRRKPGNYRVVGYSGNKLAVERSFMITE